MKEPCLHVFFDLMRTNTLGFTALILLASLSTSFTIGAQQQTPPPPRPAAEQPPITFKVEVNYVEIDAIVTDQQGNFVRNLTKDDFQVPEQGKPQTVSVASLVDIPVEKFDPPLFKTKPIEPDVRSNRKEFDGRVFVHRARRPQHELLALGARQGWRRGSSSSATSAPTTSRRSCRPAARSRPARSSPSSRERLLRAVDNFMGQKERSGTLERIDDYYRTQGTGMTGRAARPERGDSRLQGAEHVHGAQERRRLHGRHPRPAQGRRLLQRRHRLRHLRSDQQHLRDRRPAVRPGCDCRRHARQRQLLRRRPARPVRLRRRGRDCRRCPTTRRSTSDCRPLQRELQISQDSLRTLSDETGGFAAVNSNDFSKSFARIIQDNSSYYVLGYYSNDTKRDGQFRTLTVRVKQPGPAGARAQGLRRAEGPAAGGHARAGGHRRVDRHARGARQSRAGHRTLRSPPLPRR